MLIIHLWRKKQMDKSIFDLEVKEKKNQAFLNKARTGARGGSRGRKGMRTPFDYMSRIEKKKLNGEVESYNMFTTILNWNEWNQKDKTEQKELMIKWREIYSNAEIMKTLGEGRATPFNTQSFADIINNLGCPPKRKKVQSSGEKSKRKAKPVTIAEVQEKPSILELALELDSTHEQYPIQTNIVTNGLHLEYIGEYDAEQLSKIFTKLQLLIDGEENKFKISLQLTECEKGIRT